MKIDFENFKKKCKDAGMRVTPQRIAIYRVLMDSEEHPDTERIYRQVKKEFSTISFATVHLNLLKFSDLDLIGMVEDSGGGRRFDSNMSPHHHFKCMHCGKIFDFQSKAYDSLPDPRELLDGFQIIRQRVVISGICQDCQKKSKCADKFP